MERIRTVHHHAVSILSGLLTVIRRAVSRLMGRAIPDFASELQALE